MYIHGALSLVVLATFLPLATTATESPISESLYRWLGKVKEVFGYESCQDPWLIEDFHGLRTFFEHELHGQHLVMDVTIKSIRGHISYEDPQKALVLSFHGLTGNGKNYVSKAIAESLYKLGMNSRYVHLFSVTSSFPHESKVKAYSDNLRQWVSGNASACHRNLFIFDEVDRMHPGLMDTLKPYLDNYHSLGGVDYRKNIFIFLGNIGGRNISDYTAEQWTKGRAREDIKLKELEPILQRISYNEGGLWRSRMIEHGLVSAFVPFLPMQLRHVKLCIRDDLRRKGRRITENLVQQVADELQYFPPDLKLFSTTGCKRVSQKVDQVLEHDEL